MAASRKKAAKNLSFNEAVGEVEEILAGLESENVDIDKLGEEVGRAVELIQVCRAKLEKTETEVRALVQGLEADGAPAGTAQQDAADSQDLADSQNIASEDLPF